MEEYMEEFYRGACEADRDTMKSILSCAAFAAVVSEATPMSELRHLPESLQQMNSKLLAFDIPHGITQRSISGVIEFTGAYFPVLQALVVVCAFGAYLALTRTFSLRGFLRGLPTGLLALSFGFA